jgi:class I fructose-bisphosphate aldolase
MIGKDIRLERIINRNTGKAVIVPMDHGVSSGPILGITNMKEAMSQVAKGGANAVVVHKGVVARGHRKSGPDMGLIVHLSGSTSLSPEPNSKTLVCTLEEAIKLGADGVSIHVNIGDSREREMLTDLGSVAREAAEWGMPLLAMIYPRGPYESREVHSFGKSGDHHGCQCETSL